MGIRVPAAPHPPPVTDIEPSIAERNALNRLQYQRTLDQERRQLVENNPNIDQTAAQEYLTQSAVATQTVTQQTQEVLQRNNSHIQAIPSASADANDRGSLADRAIQEETAARAATARAQPQPTFAEGTQGPTSVINLPQPTFAEGTQGPQELLSPVPNVASGNTPTGSSNASPQAVRQQAAAQTTSQSPQGPRPAASNATSTGASAPGTTTVQLGPLQLEFEPNAHNEYDRVAYVFKLCMINDLDAENPDLLNDFLNNKIRKIVIAESGVTTGFAIGDVEITDAISANFRNRSNMTTGLRIQIVEPYSLTLPDKMFLASQTLGIRNWRLAPFLLQMEFRYIKQDGSLYTPSGSQKLIKVYQLLITDFDAQLTETGTKYDVQAGVKGNLGFRDAYQILPQSHRIDSQQPASQNDAFSLATGGENTVGAFFSKLGSTISNMYVELRQGNRTGARLPVLIYKFVVEGELGRQEINFSAESNSRRRSFRTGAANTGEILVSRGISVSALVDDILASLKDARFFLTEYADGGLVKIPVIECVTRNVGWDLITNDYVREFTFFIRMKLSNRPIPFTEYGETIQESPNLQRARLQALSKNLRKRYDYFYTGLNTEIISCDIKFNQLHIIPQALVTVTPPMAPASAVSVNPNDAAITGTAPTSLIRQLSQDRQALDRVNVGLRNSSSSTIPDTATEDLLLEQQVIQSRIQAIVERSVITFEDTPELQSRLGAITNKDAQALEFRQAINATRERNLQLASRREFVEDIQIPIVDNMLQLTYHADPRDIINSMARPMNIESPNGNDAPNATRPMVSSILQQIYDRSGQHLLEIDLEIKGDPYWLGVTDLERSQELLGFLQRLQPNQPVPNSLGIPTNESGVTGVNRTGVVDKHDQDANILLKFRAGTAPKEDTGYMNLSEGSTFFYGVYTVIECIHEFKSGKFTQRLKSYRDVMINVDHLRRADTVATSTNQPTQVATVAAAPAAPAASGAAAAPRVSTPPAAITNNNTTNPTRGAEATVNTPATPAAASASAIATQSGDRRTLNASNIARRDNFVPINTPSTISSDGFELGS